MMKYSFSRMGHSSYTYSSEPNSAQKHSWMLAICCPVGAFSGKLLACASSCLPMGFLGMVWELDHFIDSSSPVTVYTQLPYSECWAEHWAAPGRSMDLA